MSAARKTAGAQGRGTSDLDSPRVLPIPEPVLQHHGRTLFGLMESWLRRKRPPPVLLLTGLPGVGKRSMAHFLSQWIFCERVGLNNPTEPSEPGRPETPEPALFPTKDRADPAASRLRPCGECPGCRKAIRGSWVDFTEIAPEGSSSDDEPASSSSLKIDQFRRLMGSMGFGAHEGVHRIILIANADRMTVQAANSVLKLLEEPPRGWIFLLTATDSTLLLPTIVSRCQTVRLRPFAPEILQELLALAGVDPMRREISSRLAQGSWGKALGWADDEVWERRKGVLDFIREPVSALGGLVEWASQDARHLDRLVDQLESLAADLIGWSLSPSRGAPERHAWINSDAAPALLALAKEALSAPDRARDSWISHAFQLAEARRKLLAPVNRKILAQDLLIPWLQDAELLNPPGKSPVPSI